MVQSHKLDAVELSALRQPELIPLLDSLDSLDLSAFSYVSIHAPSQFELNSEEALWGRVHRELSRGWPIVVHPDALTDMGLWREFGPLLCIENMDKRKPIGRTMEELGRVFTSLPEASFCFDIGHARQCDPTMTEAVLILRAFGSRLREVHVSEVNTRSKHDTLSYTSILAFQQIAHLIPENIPLILETPVDNEGQMAEEIAKTRKALPVTPHLPVAPRASQWAATLGDKQKKSIRLYS
jgi:hypothetical protein